MAAADRTRDARSTAAVIGLDLTRVRSDHRESAAKACLRRPESPPRQNHMLPGVMADALTETLRRHRNQARITHSASGLEKIFDDLDQRLAFGLWQRASFEADDRPALRV